MQIVTEAGPNPEQALDRRASRGVIVSFGAQGVRFTLQFLSQILLARLLAPAEFGLVAMAIPILVLAQTIGELGLAQAIIQRPVLPQADLSGLFWFSLLVNALLAAAMVATAPAAAWFYDQPLLALVLPALAALLLPNAVAAQHMALMARRLQFGRMAIVDVACLVVATAVGIGCALAGFGLWSLVAMQGGNVVAMALLASVLSGWRPSRPGRAGGIRPMLGFGAHLLGNNLLSYAGSNLDGVLIGYAAGSTSLGLYDRSMRLVVTPLWQLGMPLTRVATGVLARCQARPAEYRRSFLGMLQLLLLLTATVFAFAASQAGILVPAVLGPHWVGAAPVAAWLCVSAIFVPFGIAASWLFVSQGRVAAQLRWGVVRTALGLAGLVAGLPWGIEGVAVAAAVLSPVVQGAMLWGATRRGAVDLRAVAGATVPILAGTAAALVAAHVAAPFMPGQGRGVHLVASLLLMLAASASTILCFQAGRRMMADGSAALLRYRRAA